MKHSNGSQIFFFNVTKSLLMPLKPALQLDKNITVHNKKRRKSYGHISTKFSGNGDKKDIIFYIIFYIYYIFRKWWQERNYILRNYIIYILYIFITLQRSHGCRFCSFHWNLIRITFLKIRRELRYFSDQFLYVFPDVFLFVILFPQRVAEPL